MSGKNVLGCSSCGETKDLYLVTKRFEDSSKEGRILLYCTKCREEKGHNLGISIPLEEVTREVFLDLYIQGETQSDPETAVEIVFGDSEHDLVGLAKQIMDLRKRTITKKKKCPKCGEHEGVEIVYGYPTNALWEQVERGEVALGGCLVTPENPRWWCRVCKHRWGKESFA